MRSKKTYQVLRRSSDPPPPEEEEAELDSFVEPSVFGGSDAGCVRDNNEDQFVIADLARTMEVHQCGFAETAGNRLVDKPTSKLWMVADGMGGHVGGEVASAVVVDMMVQYAFKVMPWLGANAGTLSERALADGLREAVQETQTKMLEVAARKRLGGGMGSTLTLAYVHWPMLYLVHVGDSRAYLGRGGELFRLTRDHNLAEEMIRQDVMTEAEARKSRFGSVLTNALGGGSKEVNVELHQVELKEDDLVLLCTDGLYGEVDDDDIAARLAGVTTAELVKPCVEGLIDAAKRAGGRDNVTVVLAKF